MMTFTKAELAAKHAAALAAANAKWAGVINVILGPDADAKMRESAIMRLVQAGVFPAFRAATVAQEMGIAVAE